MTDSRLFRKVAVDRSASPEQLDLLMRVTEARSWIALAGLAAVLLTAIVWSIAGRIPTRVAGRGILIRGGGVVSIVATASGQVQDVLVGPGERLTEGQVVARIAQPALVDEVDKARARLEELLSQETRLTALGDARTKVRGMSLDQERAELRAAIAAARERRRIAADRLASAEKLRAQGLITKDQVVDTGRQVGAADQDLLRATTELKGLAVREQEFQSQRSQEELSGEHRISEQRRALALLEERLDQSSKVRTPRAGRVIEVRTTAGSVVTPGSPILNLEPAGTGTAARDLSALVYLPPAEGKGVRPGMLALISPSTVRREKYGYILGKVSSVADFPSTRQGILRVLGNEALVESFMSARGGAPIAVEVELLSNAANPSGFAWTSGRGPLSALDSGTLLDGEITTAEEPPINRILPVFAVER